MPGAFASSDSVLHRRLVGRGAGPGTERPLTREQDVARAELREEAWGAAYDPLVGELVDPTEQIPFPSDWMGRGTAAAIARAALAQGMLTPAEAATFAADPTKGRAMVLGRDEPGAEFWIDWHIEQAWWERVDALSTQMREARAMVGLFGAPRRPRRHRSTARWRSVRKTASRRGRRRASAGFERRGPIAAAPRARA